MIIKLFTQLILASTILQFFPADAGELEPRVTFPEAPVRSFDLFETYDIISHRLPEAPDRSRVPVKLISASMGVVTNAQSAIVVDRASQEVLFEKNVAQPRAIGSITKLMTAYVFLQGNPDLDAPATLTSEDLRYGAELHLSIGETVTVRDLLKASLVGSDNSSTAALARLSGMSEGDFIARMNEVAAEFGMQQTTFDDTTGLSSKNVSVVSDLAMMFDKILENETITQITQLSSVTITGNSGRTYLVESTDELLGTFVDQQPYDIVGGKTGYLPEAGYCLGTLFSHENGGEIIVVVLGSETKEGRFQDVKSLAVWAYKTFDWSTL
ncbi:D-alanyl-D-alanine carboxypeptidase [Patescibacteria group bacterium]|nr:MAG: D-alanyl-D-alanine carboxypeptidase [Patescibacteria group bacterium]